MKKIIIIFTVAGLFCSANSCSNDWLNLAPSTSLSSLDAVENYNDVYSLMIGAYHGLRNTGAAYYGATMWYYGDVRADDMQARTTGMRASACYEMIYTALSAPNLWSSPYGLIHRANEVIFAIEEGTADDGAPADVNNLLGQALTIRALCHFDLVRVYGKPYSMSGAPASYGVPIIIERHVTDYKPTRNSVEEVYTAVLNDLARAIPLLPTAKLNGYINQWAAKSLLARVYLYKGDYNNAYTTAVDVINNGGYPLWEYDEYADAWKSQFGKENIFELIIQSNDAWTDREGIAYLLNEEGYADYIMTKSFIDLMDQPENLNDIRHSVMKKPTLLNFLTDPFWDVPVFLTKLPGQGTDLRFNNIPMFRIAEQYLIAAEAALKKSSPDQAMADTYLNALISKRNPTKAPVTATEEAIITERRIELVGEGHRFFDCMRLDLTIERPDGGWHVPLILDSRKFDRNYYRTLLPIPSGEMDANSNIRGQQNPGY